MENLILNLFNQLRYFKVVDMCKKGYFLWSRDKWYDNDRFENGSNTILQNRL